MKRIHLLAALAALGLAHGAPAWADVKIGLLTTLTGPGSVSYTHLTLPTIYSV